MIRKTLMLGLLAGLLTLGACDWYCDSDTAAKTDGAALESGDCAECLAGCEDGVAASGLAADVVAGDAAMVCPMSGSKSGADASGECGVAADACAGASMDCGTAGQCDESAGCDEGQKQCDTPCSEEAPAKPAVQD